MFAYHQTEYEYLDNIYTHHPDDLTGPTAPTFAQFTIKRNHAGYGYATAASAICLASNDPAFATSVSQKLWYDSTYALANSIFAPYLRSDSININKALVNKNVVIGCELASLSLFAEYTRKLIWHRVFKGAMYVKYSDGKDVAPYFPNNSPYNLRDIYQNSDTIMGAGGFLSNIATPTINIFQEYIDLNAIALEAADIVKFFSTFNNALKIAAKNNTVIDIPGSSSVTIISHIISVDPAGSKPPTMRLSKSAFSELKNHMFCGEFYGGLLVENSDGSQSLVIMNGLVFEVVSGKVSVTTDIRTSPSSGILTNHLTDLQFSLVAAEARLNFLVSTSAKTSVELSLMRRFLLWLGQTAGSHAGKNEDLVTMQARALYLAKLAVDSSAGVPIPFLKYETYQGTINSVQDVLKTVSSTMMNFQNQIRARKAEERQINRQKNLNENIIKSGNLLRDYIQTQATYQGSLSQQFASVINDVKKELTLLDQQEKDYNSKLSKQKRIVQQKVEDYKDAVAEWQKQETIKAALDIASNIFSLGFTFLAPSSTISALASLGKVVQRIQKAVNIFNAVIKTYRSIKTWPSSPQSVVDALAGLGPAGLQLPSALEWDEMKVNMDTTLATGPAKAKIPLSAAFSILVLRGKALLEVHHEIQAKVSELSAAQYRLRIHDDQQKRLAQLKVTLSAQPKDLNVSSIDLVGLTGQLNFFEHQMLLTMASTLTIQDRALQYEYIQPPTPIKSFSFINLQLAILSQSQSINRGLVVQPVPQLQPDHIIYEIHGVKPESLINSNSFAFDISLSKREFNPYNYVRVAIVKAEIGGILSTKSKKYYTELHFDGQPFYDRGFNGETLTFQTLPRLYTFLDDVANSFHCVAQPNSSATQTSASVVTHGSSDNPFYGKISHITPFSTWRISLPPTQSNDGISFDNCPRGVTIRLTFQIFAQLKETTTTSTARTARAFHLRKRIGQMPAAQSAPQSQPLQLHIAAIPQMPVAKDVQGVSIPALQSHPIPVVPYVPVVAQDVTMNVSSLVAPQPRFFAASQPTALAATPPNVGIADVLNMMANKSVCSGWDAVFSLTAKQINDNLYTQYNDRVNNPKFLRTTGNVVHKATSSEGFKTKTAFNFTFKAPKLQFLLNNSNSAQLHFPLESGHYEYSIYFNNKWNSISKADVKESQNYYIQGDIPLAVLPGDVSSQKNIALKLNGGAFSTQGFFPATSDPLMNTALTDYFTGLKDGYEVYNLGTLDTTNITLIPSLTPTTFKFNVYHSPSNRDILQLFIATTGQVQTNTSISLREPIPSIYECSLIINTKVFFANILPTSIGNVGLGLLYKSVAPQNDSNLDKVWATEVTAGSVSGPYPPTLANSSSSAYQGGNTNTEDYVAVCNDSVSIDLTGMKFEIDSSGNSSWNADMAFNMDKREYSFKYGSRTQSCSYFTCLDWSSINYSNYSLKVTVDMNATLTFKVTGTGQNQLLQLDGIPTTNPLITGQVEQPAGFCQTNDRALQKAFLKNLRTGMEPKLKPIFNTAFTSVSLFALKNILFPAKNLVDMKEAFVPGDMIVFGNFTK